MLAPKASAALSHVELGRNGLEAKQHDRELETAHFNENALQLGIEISLAEAEAFDARATSAASSSLSAVARDAASLSSNAFGGVGCSSDRRASRATLASSARTHGG